MTGIQLVGSNIVTRSNANGAWRWDGSVWTNMLTTLTVPSSSYGNGGGTSAPVEVQMAPSDVTKMYMKFGGYVLYSSNSGNSWTDTGLAHDTDDPNGPNSGTGGPFLGIDPQNPDIVVNSDIGTGGSDGLYYTLNGTHQPIATWTLATGPAKAASGGFMIQYDPSSSVLGGVKQGIFACSSGTGCYHTTTGPAGTWSSIVAGGPTAVVQAHADLTGTLWAVGGGLWRWRSGTWTQVLTDSGCNNSCGSVVTDPSNCSSTATCRVFVSDASGLLNISLDGGGTFSRVPSFSVAATDVPWLATTDQSYMSLAGYMQMDASGKLYAGTGTGVFTATPPTTSITSTPIVWTSQTIGIENLVPTMVLAPPGGGRATYFAWDRPAFYNSSASSYSTAVETAYPGNYIGIEGGWSADYVYSSPSTMVVAAGANVGNLGGLSQDLSSVSTDGGQTWTPFGSPSSTSVVVGRGPIVTFGSITGGTLYTTGTYNGVALTGGSGSGATANITVAGGAVTAVTLVSGGTGYAGGNTLSASAASIGGTGSGFSVPVATNGAVFTTGTGLAITASDSIIAIDNTSNSSHGNQIAGTVGSYNSGTGALQINMTGFTSAAQGSTISSWIIHTIPSEVYNGHPGGCIAAVTTSKFVWLPGDGASNAYYTNNGGVNWSAVSGLPTNGWQAFAFNKRNGRCAADRAASRFYLYNTGGTGPGFYSCDFSTSTPSCVKNFTGTITTDDGFPIMKTSPEGAGIIYMSFGAPQLWKRSVDFGVTWSNLQDAGNNISNVNAFGFGAVHNGQTKPSIYYQGFNGAAAGVKFYRSIDNAATWTLVDQWPNNSMTIIKDIDGDKTTPGTVYGGPDGSGWWKLN